MDSVKLVAILALVAQFGFTCYCLGRFMENRSAIAYRRKFNTKF